LTLLAALLITAAVLAACLSIVRLKASRAAISAAVPRKTSLPPGGRQFGSEAKTKQQEMEAQGYVNYGGKWMTLQEQNLQQQRGATERVVKEWKGRLERWRGWLENGHEAEAFEEIDRISDPLAIPALKEALARDQVEEHRKRYIDALARIGTVDTRQLLCALAIEDVNPEIRLTSLDCLEAHPTPNVVDYFVKRLGDRNNAMVNRAALGLARMKNESAIGPLIDHLVTPHKFLISPGSDGSNGALSCGLEEGLSHEADRREAPKIIVRQLENDGVLEALVTLTGVNFSFDADSWKKWHSRRTKPQSLNARRDAD
jgi:hypothetical protein